MRNMSKRTRRLITVDDVVWAEAGWRAFTRGVGNVWLWALYQKHERIALLYVPDITTEEAEWGMRSAAKAGMYQLVEGILNAGLISEQWHFVWAASRNLPKVISLFLELPEFAPLNITLSVAFREACLRGHVKVVDLVLDAAAAKDMTIQVADDILRAVCEKGHADLVRLLFELGAPHDPDDALLATAASGGHLAAVNVLLELGVRDWMVAGVDSAMHAGHPDIVKALRGAGAHVEARHIRAAAADGNEGLLRALLPFEDTTVLSAALVTAAESGYSQCVTILHSAGGTERVSCDRALCRAASRGDGMTVRALLDCGAARDLSTALALSVLRGHEEVEKVLLEAGAPARTLDDQLRHKIMYYYQIEI
jgi:ankyrin repeat protein